MKMELVYFLFNLKTLKRSKKSWKRYESAGKNAGEFDIVLEDEETINWILKHPEWVKERLK